MRSASLLWSVKRTRKSAVGLLAAVSLTLSLAACTGDSGNAGDSKEETLPSGEETTQNEVEEDTAENSEDTLEPADESILGEEGSGGEGGETITAIHPWTLEDTTVVAERRGDAMVTGVRSATHDGYDRIVVDLSGNGLVGWEAQWTKNPVEMGRGERLPVAGNEFLDITIVGTRIPESDQDYKDYFDSFDPHQVGPFEWVYDGTFEGRSHLAIGMKTKTEYRIFSLSDPLRVVIDLKTD